MGLLGLMALPMKSLNGWRRLFRALALVSCGLGAFEARGQVTEGVMPVEVGTWRFDLDLYTRGEDRRLPAGAGVGRVRSEAWAWVQVGTGVGERVEARAGWQAYQRERVDGETSAGVGDLWLMAKVHLCGDEAEGPAWAVLPYVKLPTGGSRWADDTVDLGALVIFGRPLGEAGFFNAQLGIDDYGDGGGGRDRGVSGAAVAGRSLSERWSIYLEGLGGVYPSTGDKRELELALGGGVVWAGNAAGTWGLDLAGYGGLTRAAVDAQAALRFWVEWR